MKHVVRRSLRLLALSLVGAIAAVQAGCSTDDGLQPIATVDRPCPPWVDFPRDTHSNADAPFLGCANAQNLRAMLENPQDLVRGRELSQANGAREALAIERYEQGVTASAPPEAPSGTTVIVPGGTQ